MKKLIIRILLSTLGVIIIGLGCGVVVEMAVGCDTCACFNRSIYYILYDNLGAFPYGHLNLGINVVIFLFMLKIKPKLIGYGTLFNMVAVGYIVDFVHYLFTVFGASGGELNYAVRILCVFLAMPVIAFGDALYFEADLGISPYDAVAFMIEKVLKYRYSYRAVRTASDIGFLVSGFLLGFVTGRQWELANVGSVILALFTGTVIEWWRARLRGGRAEE